LDKYLWISKWEGGLELSGTNPGSLPGGSLSKEHTRWVAKKELNLLGNAATFVSVKITLAEWERMDGTGMP
jgi:hypothetical protein